MLIKYTTKSFQETQKLGKGFAKEILKKELQNPPAARAVVLGFCGNLGGGKTTFIQGFAKRLGVNEKILSPTFVIMKKFRIQNSEFRIQKFENFYHIDCYRLKNEKDILELGFKEIISNPENIVAIEWPEKIKKVLPKKTIIIKFKLIDKNTREITLDEVV